MKGSNHESCVCVYVSVQQGEVSQMAPKGFSVIVPSPGIRPLGLVASTAFNVMSKSNHLLSPWAMDPDPQRKKTSPLNLFLQTEGK